jgi:hypothetical protein
MRPTEVGGEALSVFRNREGSRKVSQNGVLSQGANSSLSSDESLGAGPPQPEPRY